MDAAQKRALAARLAKELAWVAVFVGAYLYISAGQAPALAVGGRAPSFTAERIGGGTVEVSPAVRKEKVLVFWAPWCKVCAAEMPLLGDLQASLGDKVLVVGVGLSGSRAEIARFAREKGADFPHVFGDARMDVFGIRAFPSLFVLDADNVVTARYVGLTTPIRLRLATGN
jgi:thiol-disulfide isomerase/thioredoxin